MQMPEEVNRILTSRVSNILFYSPQVAADNLQKEGYPFAVANGHKQNLENIDDVMQDSAELFAIRATRPAGFKLNSEFIFTTIHRAENTDHPERLTSILDALNQAAKTIPVVLPIHPRTRNIITTPNLDVSNLTLIEPVGYLEMPWLLKHSNLVVTDSGGV